MPTCRNNTTSAQSQDQGEKVPMATCHNKVISQACRNNKTSQACHNNTIRGVCELFEVFSHFQCFSRLWEA